MESREERLKKLIEAKQKIQNRNILPTVNKKDLDISVNSTTMSELCSSSSESISCKIEKISNSLSTLKQAKDILTANSKKKTEVVFIIDRSGSVGGTESVVSDGISKIIDNEKSKCRNEIITIVLFNEKVKTVCNRLPIDAASGFFYEADGGTALYDTLVNQIKSTFNNQSKDTNPPEKTIVVISTDGLDNCSSKTNYAAKTLIEERTNAGWEFIFLGTNFDVLDEAERLGIKSTNAVEYDVRRLKNNFKAIERALDDVYEKGSISKDWSKPITDYKQLSSSKDMQYKKKMLGE